MFTSAFQFAVITAAPALARALDNFADQARAGADVLERFAGTLRRAGYDAGAPRPTWAPHVQPEPQALTIQDLFQLAKDEGRAVYAP